MVLLLGLFALSYVGTGKANDGQALGGPSGQPVLGAGASFPSPAYSKWATNYATTKGIQVNYQSIGSGGGVKQITRRLVHFGASDYPLSAKDLQDNKLIQLPTLGGAIVLAVNLRELNDELVLDGPTVAKIYLGQITKWNDPAIKALNPAIADKLPNIYIAVLFRSDASGTTYNFTKYLAESSPEFNDKLGYGKAVNFPVGLGGKGNEGVAAVLPRVYGAIGYVEYSYAVTLQLGVPKLKNVAGAIVKAEPASFKRAFEIADWNQAIPKVTNLNDAQAWPINALTFALVHWDEAQKLTDVKDFLTFGMIDQAEETEKLHYVPLDLKVAQNLLSQLTYRAE